MEVQAMNILFQLNNKAWTGILVKQFTCLFIQCWHRLVMTEQVFGSHNYIEVIDLTQDDSNNIIDLTLNNWWFHLIILFDHCSILL